MIRNDIKALAAYHVPDSAGMIKLDAMENPFPMPDALQADWKKCLAAVQINRYPDAEMAALRGKIASHAGVNTDQVLLGNGSDEIIQMIIMAVNSGTCVVPTPTFVMYDLISRWLKRPVASAPLNKDFSLNAEQFLQVCAREKAELAFLACPTIRPVIYGRKKPSFESPMVLMDCWSSMKPTDLFPNARIPTSWPPM